MILENGDSVCWLGQLRSDTLVSSEAFRFLNNKLGDLQLGLIEVSHIRVVNMNRLRVGPDLPAEHAGFALIYRAAAWVRWDNRIKELFVTEEKVESLYDQYVRIAQVILGECGDHLKVTAATEFANIPPDVIAQITAFSA